MKITWVLTWQAPPEELNKRIPGALTRALREVAYRWKNGLLPKHFKTQGMYEYGYQPRKQKTKEIKKILGVPNLPLVQSGDLRREVMSSPGKPRIIKKGGKVPRGVSLTMKAPGYANYRRGIDKKKEITLVSPREAQGMAEHLNKRFWHYLKSAWRRKKRTR